MSWATGQLLVVENCSVIYALKVTAQLAEGTSPDVQLCSGDLAVAIGSIGTDEILFHSRSQSLVRSPGTSWFRAVG